MWGMLRLMLGGHYLAREHTEGLCIKSRDPAHEGPLHPLLELSPLLTKALDLGPSCIQLCKQLRGEDEEKEKKNMEKRERERERM